MYPDLHSSVAFLPGLLAWEQKWCHPQSTRTVRKMQDTVFEDKCTSITLYTISSLSVQYVCYKVFDLSKPHIFRPFLFIETKIFNIRTRNWRRGGGIKSLKEAYLPNYSIDISPLFLNNGGKEKGWIFIWLFFKYLRVFVQISQHKALLLYPHKHPVQ